MKILHVSPTYYSAHSVVGGGEKYIIYMIRALAQAAQKSGDDLKNNLLAFGDQPGHYLLNDDIPCQVLLGKPWDPYSIFLPDLQEKLISAQIIIVHQCLTAFGLFVASHARLSNKIVIGVDEGGGEHPLIYHTPEAAQMFDLFLAYSQYAATSFMDLNVPIKIILGPVDTSYYMPAPIDKRNPNLVAAVGRLLPHKGFDRIIKALPDGLRLVIVGTRSDPKYFEYLQSLIPHFSDKITIKEGFSDSQVRGLLHQASLFVHASTHWDYQGAYYAKPELLGLAPLEALACGTPTLVSTAGSLSELGAIPGCRTFSSDQELAELLYLHRRSPWRSPDPQEIYRAVNAQYGIAQFGDPLLTELKNLSAL